MSAYISEIAYQHIKSNDFVEIVVPEGTDVSGYTIEIYRNDGTLKATLSLGDSVATIDGYDVYIVDSDDPAFANIDGPGAVALSDGTGTVLQFVSFEGNTVTATEGTASGQTSTSIGETTGNGNSLETTDAARLISIKECQTPEP